MAVREGADKLPSAAKISASLGGWWSFLPLVLIVVAALRQIRRGPLPELPDRAALQRAPDEPRRYVPQAFGAALWELIAKPHTTLQLSAFLQPHQGEWVELEAVIQGVHYVRDDSHFVQVSRGPTGPTLGVEFDKAWGQHLARLSPGDPVRFRAQIVGDVKRCKLQRAEMV